MNGSVALQCKGGGVETFLFIMQNSNSYLLSWRENGGRANAVFNDGVSRPRLRPDGYVTSAKAGVDVSIECA